jgi:hypothetical protein
LEELVGLNLKQIGIQANIQLRVLFTTWSGKSLKVALSTIQEHLSTYSSTKKPSTISQPSPPIQSINELKSISPSSSNLSSHQPSSNSPGPMIERNVRIFKFSDSMINWSEKIQLPDSFFDLTEEDARNYYLKTSYSNLSSLEKKFPKTTIRIVFPDQIYLEAQFQINEPSK